MDSPKVVIDIQQPLTVGRENASSRYSSVFALAVRLVRGETLAAADIHGRVWVGTASALAVRLPGTGATGAVLDGVDAFEVASRLHYATHD